MEIIQITTIPPATIALPLTLLLAAVLFLLVGIRRSSSSRNNDPPAPPSGPPALPVIGHLYLLLRRRRPLLHHVLAEISSRHGPVVLLRFGSRRILLVSSPSAMEECFTTNDVVFANRPSLVSGKHFGYNHTIFGFLPYSHRWRNLRRIAAMAALSSARIAELRPSRAAEIRSFVLRLYRDHLAGAGAVNLKARFSELSMNLLMGMAAGKRYHGEGGVDAAEARRFVGNVDEVFRLSGVGSMEDFLPAARWLGFGSAAKRMEKVGKEMDSIFQEMVEDRRRSRRGSVAGDEEEEEGKKTVIDVMLGLQEIEPETYTDEAIKGMVTSILTAGTDTTAGTMEWAMALLLNHPEAMRKAKEEVDLVVGRRRMVTDGDVGELRYLQGVIKETLRLYPAGPLLVPHESSGECVVGGYRVPAGTMLLVNAYAVHREGRYWEDPLEFRPERFMTMVQEDEEDGSSAAATAAAEFKYIPFGSGRRRCPGELLAMRTILLTMAALLQCFEWAAPATATAPAVDMTEGLGLTMPKAQPLIAIYKPIDSMIDLLSTLSQEYP